MLSSKYLKYYFAFDLYQGREQEDAYTIFISISYFIDLRSA